MQEWIVRVLFAVWWVAAFFGMIMSGVAVKPIQNRERKKPSNRF
jgi:hypothetical protein